MKVIGLGIVLVLAWASWQASLLAQAWGKAATGPWGDLAKSIEYPIFAVLFGLLANVLLSRWQLKPRTELFLKVGLVLLGTTINVTTVLKAGGGGVLQGIIMVGSVFAFSWWIGGKFGLAPTMKAVMSCAVAICGVSAAIAAAGAVLAKKQELAYVTTLVIVTALPLMVLMPVMAGAMGLTPAIAGAWFGGNIDTTAAVVGAGTIYGPKAQQVASIVKMSQNALIGLVAFLLALYFAVKVEHGQKPSVRIIWDRFPKFVIGFICAMLIASYTTLLSADALAGLSNLRNWAFAMAFVGIGMELDFRQLRQVGVRPFWAYMTVTVFNTTLALGVAYIIFGVLFPL